MRILLISSSSPGDTSFGGGQRDNNLREALLGLGSVDTIICTAEDPPTRSQSWTADRVQWVNMSATGGKLQRLGTILALRGLVRRAERENHYDLIVARHFFRALGVPFRAHAKLIIDADDLRVDLAGASVAKRLAVRAWNAVVRWVARRARHVWIVDSRDRELLDLPPKRVSLLPNTARPPARISVPSLSGRRLLMVGLYAYPPNAEGLLWFVRNVMPDLARLFPDVELHAVGNYYQPKLKALQHPVLMRGFVDDLAAEYAQADAVICPIISGTGTQIKVIEALMHGRPTVASRFSHAGFADVLTPDRHLVVADDPAEWVDKLAAVLREPERFAGMAEEGRRVAAANYSVESFRERVVATVGAGRSAA